MKSSNLSPLGQAPRLSATGDPQVVALVASLLNASRPSHVARLIVAVVVGVAVELVGAIRAWTYGGIERLKAIHPLITHTYSAPAVVVVMLVVLVQAPSENASPYRVLWSVNHAVGAVRLANQTATKASATSSAGFPMKGSASDLPNRPAITLAPPHLLPAELSSIRQNFNCIAANTSQVNKPLVVGLGRFLKFHLTTPINKKVRRLA
jgi:hypothetical protein